MSSDIINYSGERQGEGLENSFELLVTYPSIPVAFSEPAFPRLCGVFIHYLQHLVVSPHPKILIKPPKLAAWRLMLESHDEAIGKSNQETLALQL
jgi:hypothetical protein